MPILQNVFQLYSRFRQAQARNLHPASKALFERYRDAGKGHGNERQRLLDNPEESEMAMSLQDKLRAISRKEPFGTHVHESGFKADRGESRAKPFVVGGEPAVEAHRIYMREHQRAKKAAR